MTNKFAGKDCTCTGPRRDIVGGGGWFLAPSNNAHIPVTPTPSVGHPTHVCHPTLSFTKCPLLCHAMLLGENHWVLTQREAAYKAFSFYTLQSSPLSGVERGRGLWRVNRMWNITLHIPRPSTQPLTMRVSAVAPGFQHCIHHLCISHKTPCPTPSPRSAKN